MIKILPYNIQPNCSATIDGCYMPLKKSEMVQHSFKIFLSLGLWFRLGRLSLPLLSISMHYAVFRDVSELRISFNISERLRLASLEKRNITPKVNVSSLSGQIGLFCIMLIIQSNILSFSTSEWQIKNEINPKLSICILDCFVEMVERTSSVIDKVGASQSNDL